MFARAEVGLSKNTVAVALSLLRESGLVTFTQARGNDGEFGAGRYVIVLPGDVFTVAAPSPGTAPSAPSTLTS